MKKVPVEVHRTSANTAQFIIPDHLDYLEVRGIIESIMEQIMMDSLREPKICAVVDSDILNNLLERGEHD